MPSPFWRGVMVPFIVHKHDFGGERAGYSEFSGDRVSVVTINLRHIGAARRAYGPKSSNLSISL
jgi:hypothetical protein